ncbi:MAG: peptide deformylase, partial [Candidatus Methylumidiphilus sp.]
MTKPDSLQLAFARCMDLFGGLDILVVNAGIASPAYEYFNQPQTNELSLCENGDRRCFDTMTETILKLRQTGELVLRQPARPLSVDEIHSPETQRLIAAMRNTLRDAPGVGLAAPQVGYGIQLAIIEDRAEYQQAIPPDQLAERGRQPVPFQVIVNPTLSILDPAPKLFFEGCLSVAG